MTKLERLNENWYLDPHVHLTTGRPDCDAKENTVETLTRVYGFLYAQGKINAFALLCHDNFPERADLEFIEDELGIPGLYINEVTANYEKVDNNFISGLKFNIAHVMVIFSEPPENWPFETPVKWPSSIIARLRKMRNLENMELVMRYTKDEGGTNVVNHPSPFPFPWGSLDIKELEDLYERGQLESVGIEAFNSHTAYMITSGIVCKIAENYKCPIYTGSDAHKPDISEGLFQHVGPGSGRIEFKKVTGVLYDDLQIAHNNNEINCLNGGKVVYSAEK